MTGGKFKFNFVEVANLNTLDELMVFLALGKQTFSILKEKKKNKGAGFKKKE